MKKSFIGRREYARSNKVQTKHQLVWGVEEMIITSGLYTNARNTQSVNDIWCPIY